MQVDVFADLSCSWCYLGVMRLRKALALRPHIFVAWRWHPFLVDGDIPPYGVDRLLYLSSKYGGVDRGRQVTSTIQMMADGDQIPMNLSRISTTPHTAKAHRFVMAAASCGYFLPALDAVFHAFFVAGRDIGQTKVLLELGAQIGLPSDIQTDFTQNAVRPLSLDPFPVTCGAVPFFVIANQFAMAGAQDVITWGPLIDVGVLTTSEAQQAD